MTIMSVDNARGSFTVTQDGDSYTLTAKLKAYKFPLVISGLTLDEASAMLQDRAMGSGISEELWASLEDS